MHGGLAPAFVCIGRVVVFDFVSNLWLVSPHAQ